MIIVHKDSRFFSKNKAPPPFSAVLPVEKSRALPPQTPQPATKKQKARPHKHALRLLTDSEIQRIRKASFNVARGTSTSATPQA